jgi:prolyl-tRNA synthetase
LADAGDLAHRPELVTGYIGPQVLASLDIPYLVDPMVTQGSTWVTGANRPGRHAVDVVRGRDFVPNGEIGAVEIVDGDRCPRCDAPLRLSRGIELGHVFQLGRKYAEVFGLEVSGPDGKPAVVTMGSYGVGVSRAVAAVAEQTLDDLGLCWPRSVAPADVHLVATGKGEGPYEAGDALVADLERRGLRVLYDDRRGVSPGVKFRDAELIGIPLIVVAGRGVADGVAEVRHRATGERRELTLSALAQTVADQLRDDEVPLSSLG